MSLSNQPVADVSTANALNFQLIASDAELASMVEACLSQPHIAVDTEFIRTDTFYPKPALLQIYDRRTIYLLDPLSISDYAPLITLFSDPGTIKVMHSCSEDMEVFDRLLGVYPAPLVDTQIAASLVGLDFSMSYQRLVEAALDKQLEKGETRSDWLQRPLTANQLKYAVDDVLWLLDVYDVLTERLATLQRGEWLVEECEDLLSRARQTPAHEDYYLKLKAAWRLDRRALNTLRGLCAWREREAREQNVPRSRIFSDANLLEIAKARPQDKGRLAKIRDIKPSSIRQYAQPLFDQIAKAESVDPADWPASIEAKNSIELRKALKRLKQCVAEHASRLDIPESLLARRRDLEAYLFASQPDKELLGRGWRKDVFGDQLEPIVNAYHGK